MKLFFQNNTSKKNKQNLKNIEIIQRDNTKDVVNSSDLITKTCQNQGKELAWYDLGN